MGSVDALSVVSRKGPLECHVLLPANPHLFSSYTVIPVALAFVVMLFHWVVILKELPSLGKSFYLGVTLGQVALFFFYKGLDDNNDW